MENSNQIAKRSQTGVQALSKQIAFEIQRGKTLRISESNEELLSILKHVFILVGLKPDQFPNNESTKVLVGYIRDNYSNYTAYEIKIAFEMVIKTNSDVDFKHYGNFSPVYFSRIFKAYLEHRNKIALEVEKERVKNDQIESQEEIDRKVSNFLNEAVDMYRASDFEFKGSKSHAKALYERLKINFTDNELINFKKTAKIEMDEEKKRIEEKQKWNKAFKPIFGQSTFTLHEWKCRTALITVNEALKKGIEL